MCEKHVFSAAVEQNDRNQSRVWVSTPQRDNLFCFLFSGTIIVGLIFLGWRWLYESYVGVSTPCGALSTRGGGIVVVSGLLEL